MNRRHLAAVVVVLAGTALVPLFYPAAWGGADVAATDQVEAVAPGYDTWIEPLWTPPSSTAEAALFAVQAAGGGALLWYGLRRLDGNDPTAQSPDGD